MDEKNNKFERDIAALRACIKNRDNESAIRLHDVLINSYKQLFPKMDDRLFLAHTQPVYIPDYDDGPTRVEGPDFLYDNIYKNLDILANTIENFLESNKIKASNGTSASGNQQITNVNIVNQLALNLSFPEVRNQIANMEQLGSIEAKEINDRISELEAIIDNKTLKRKDKWARLSGIIKWIADKGVDVGIAIIPLLLKI